MATATHAEARAAMAAWTNPRGQSPLGNASAVDADSRSGELLTNAAAILSLLSAAAHDMDTLGEQNRDSQFQLSTGVIFSAALDGVGDLINLASFLLED